MDLDSFINQRKRQCLSSILTTTSTISEDEIAEQPLGDKLLSKEQREQMKRKLIEKYFSELPESERTREGILNYVKYMIKNIQLSDMTGGEYSSEGALLIEWILENEPQILIEISKFWVYNAYSLSSQKFDSYYHKQLHFILAALEDNRNIMLYSLDRFSEWLSFIRGLPLMSEEVFEHARSLLLQLRPDHVERNYVSFFIDSIIVNKFTLRREDRERFLKLLLNVMTTSTESLYELYRSIFLDKYFDTDKLSDLSEFAVSVIVDTFKNPDGEDHIRNIVSLFSDIVKRVPDHNNLPLIIEAYFLQTNQATLSCKIEEMVTALGIQSDDKSLITLLNSHSN